MPTLSKNIFRRGSTNSEPNPTLTTSSHATYSSRQQPPVISNVPIAREKKSVIIWNGTSSQESLMKQESMAQDHSRCIFLANHSYGQISSQELATLRHLIQETQYFSQQTELYLKEMEILTDCWHQRLTKSSGHGGRKSPSKRKPKRG